MQFGSRLTQRRYRFPAGAVAVSLTSLVAAPLLCSAQVAADDPLRFAGFTAGAELSQVTSALRTHRGQRLGCTRSRADSTVQECRSTYPDSSTGRTVEVWLSAIGGNTAILILKTDGSLAQVERWRSDLTARYGKVETRTQGAQRMMQWVRRGRMIRLTWRVDRAAPAISVSLVDGRVLDGWGKARE